MAQSPDDLQALKRHLRLQAHAKRRKQPDKDRLSREICRKLATLPEYRSAATVMFYLDIRTEVRTRPFLPAVGEQGKRIVVPYCVEGQIELFRMESLDELAAGTFGILEPPAELRGRADRKVEVSELDLIVVPGVAFDRKGARLGHGGGYYDKLLRLVRPDTAVVALAFECQLFPAIPMQPHDVYMQRVITERTVYQ